MGLLGFRVQAPNQLQIIMKEEVLGASAWVSKAGPLELRVQKERVLVFYGFCNKLP